MTPLHRWDGRYVGFRVDDHLYTAAGRPFGWVDEDGRVWHVDGRYLGSMFEESYVLREGNATLRTRRRMHPARPLRPFQMANRPPRHPHPRLEDGLAWLGNGTHEAPSPVLQAPRT
jgi:hypothetical protein